MIKIKRIIENGKEFEIIIRDGRPCGIGFYASNENGLLLRSEFKDEESAVIWALAVLPTATSQ